MRLLMSKKEQSVVTEGVEITLEQEENENVVTLEQGGNTNTDNIELFEEKDDVKHPEVINRLKKVWQDKTYQFRSLRENQTSYPFEYNLYDKDTKIDKNISPKAKIAVKDINHIVLISDDLGPFITTMMALKKNGAETIDIKLNTDLSEQKQKEFAARAFIAGVLTGIEIKGSPYSLEDLKDVNDMIPKLINLEKGKTAAKKAAEEYVANRGKENKQKLEKEIETAFNSYKRLEAEEITPLEKMEVFKCGIEGIKDKKIKSIAEQVQRKIEINNRNR